MLRLFRESLLEYANSWWGQQIFIWSSVASFLGALVLLAIMGIGSGHGAGSPSSQFATVVTVVIAVPVLVVFNLTLALLWATLRTVVRLLLGS